MELREIDASASMHVNWSQYIPYVLVWVLAQVGFGNVFMRK